MSRILGAVVAVVGLVVVEHSGLEDVGWAYVIGLLVQLGITWAPALAGEPPPKETPADE